MKLEWTGEQEAHFTKEMQEAVNLFKDKMREVCKDAISDFYCDVAPYAYGDGLTNFRNKILEDLVDDGKMWHKSYPIRQAILEKHYDSIVKDINKDLHNDNCRLKEEIRELRESISRMVNRQ